MPSRRPPIKYKWETNTLQTAHKVMQIPLPALNLGVSFGIMTGRIIERREIFKRLQICLLARWSLQGVSLIPYTLMIISKLKIQSGHKNFFFSREKSVLSLAGPDDGSLETCRPCRNACLRTSLPLQSSPYRHTFAERGNHPWLPRMRRTHQSPPHRSQGPSPPRTLLRRSGRSQRVRPSHGRR